MRRELKNDNNQEWKRPFPIFFLGGVVLVWSLISQPCSSFVITATPGSCIRMKPPQVRDEILSSSTILPASRRPISIQNITESITSSSQKKKKTSQRRRTSTHSPKKSQKSNDKSKRFVNQNALHQLLQNDDHQEEEEEAAGQQIASKKVFSKMSDESKMMTSITIRQQQPKGKFRASVKETGKDSMGHYLKTMGNHELLRHEDEIVLGRQIQILVQWEEKRQELEETLVRTPTFSEWADAIQQTVPELKKQIRRSQKAKTALIEANLRLVVTIARQSLKTRPGVSFQDACQEGIIGLNKACEKFDPDKGFRFSTYANWWIKREIVQTASSTSNTMKAFRLPYHVIRKINEIKIAEVTLREQLNGRKPSDTQLAKKLEMTMEQIQFYKKASQDAFSLDNSLSAKQGKGSSASGATTSNDSFTLNDIIRDPSQTPTELADKQMLQQDVRRLIKTLSPREQAVIRLRYGLGEDGVPKTLNEIGERFRVSMEKIRTIEARALLKLRQPYRNQSLKCYISDL